MVFNLLSKNLFLTEGVFLLKVSKNFFFFIMRNLFQSEVNFTMEILKLMTEIFDGNIYLKLNSKLFSKNIVHFLFKYLIVVQ